MVGYRQDFSAKQAQLFTWLVPILFIVTVAAKGQQFFPAGALDPHNPKLDRFRTTWYSKQLVALAERSLFEAQQDQTLQSYRFVWLRTFHHPIAIRVLIHPDGSGTLVTKVADGAGGYEPGKLIVNRTQLLPQERVNELMGKIQGLGYWTLSSRDPNRLGLDGAQWIIEGVNHGQYHVVDRWSPRKDPVRELGLYFLRELSKLKEEVIY